MFVARCSLVVMACVLAARTVTAQQLTVDRQHGEAVHECARIAAMELEWDAERTAEEVLAVNLFYAIKSS